MFYDLKFALQNQLLNLPETGMGYQVIEASKAGYYSKERYLVLNSGLAIEMDSQQNEFVRKVMRQGFSEAKASAPYVDLTGIRLLNENEFRNIVNERKSANEKGAIDNPEENANGEEIFVRLSAFDDDKRVDKMNLCLRPGSFTTTMDDYLKCKATSDDPVERYALPSDDEIKWAFHIQPKKQDTLQRGIVQPANGKRGGGKEAYFKSGTSAGTFLKQTAY